MTADVATNE